MKSSRSLLADKITKKRVADRSRRANERQLAKLVGISPVTLWVTGDQKLELQSLIGSKGWVVVSPRAAMNSFCPKTADENMRPVAFSGPSVQMPKNGSNLGSKPKKIKREVSSSKIALGNFELKFEPDDLFGSPAEASRDQITEAKGGRLLESGVPISLGTGLVRHLNASDQGGNAEANRNNCLPAI